MSEFSYFGGDYSKFVQGMIDRAMAIHNFNCVSTDSPHVPMAHSHHERIKRFHLTRYHKGYRVLKGDKR
jgi:hypothetical protein